MNDSTIEITVGEYQIIAEFENEKQGVNFWLHAEHRKTHQRSSIATINTVCSCLLDAIREYSELSEEDAECYSSESEWLLNKGDARIIFKEIASWATENADWLIKALNEDIAEGGWH